MPKVRFYDTADDGLLKFAVIVSVHQGKWVFCKHRARETFEAPGGHREAGESILAAAERELFEETGASDFTIRTVCVYSVADENGETFGMLYFAEIRAFQKLPDFEMERVELFDALPARLTYPAIQPKLMEKAASVCRIGGRAGTALREDL